MKKSKKDKLRIGFRPTKGENQWSRICQNSGKIKRQPLIFKENEIDKIIEMGYKYNEKTNIYEKEIEVKKKKKNKTIKLLAIKLSDDSINNLIYVCDDKINNDYM